MTSVVWITIFIGLGAFLLGSIPVGYLVAKAKGINIKEVGSGNIGATNAIRALGSGWGILIGVLDALKGAIPALIALKLTPYPGVAAAAGFGHIFSPWLGFKAGKGVATTLAVFLVLAPLPTASSLLLWIILLLGIGYVSLASILSMASLPLTITAWNAWMPEISIIIAAALCSLVVIWAHRGNIKRILAHEEPRAGLWKRLWKK